ncbi:MAG TPA: agmatine deiminase family protein [Candidatus Eisenbacteria bacterium]|nr:agmatine deiminase family protein [Candidatus Eisenbacteria bacterium]
MPAEWEPHAATWIAWPHNRTDWPGKFAPIPWVYAEIIRHLSRVERVNILVNNESAEAAARGVLVTAEVLPKIAAKPGAHSGNVRFWHFPTNRSWLRDTGPTFVTRAGASPLAAIAWRFNAWAKYNDWRRDAPLSAEIGRWLKGPTWQPEVEVDGKPRRVVLEGGSIEVNGRGTLLTTEECLLSDVQARNPGVSRAQLEQIFANYLGIRKVIWLGRGIAGDDTHGHVDDISRFVAPNVAVTAYEPDTSEVNHVPLRENFLQLQWSTDQSGRPFRIVKLPMPAPVYFDGQRLPASYANFYVANRLVLVPVFNDPNDRIALNVLAELFPKRTVVGIYCGDLILGLGTLHCMTQQQPRV